ncbi:hypothetical protein ACWNG8_04190 [Aeromonas veronii]
MVGAQLTISLEIISHCNGLNMTRASDNIDFVKEVDEIAEKAIDAFGLSYDKTAPENLHNPLLRWCDFILRYIPNATRHVYKSDKFPAFIPKEAEKGLKQIEELFIAGGDVNPYQSKSLTLFNDTSSKKRIKEQTCYGLIGEFITYTYHVMQSLLLNSIQNAQSGFYF